MGAWLLAVRVFSLDQPFLAPWVALLTVHATVYRSVLRGAQSVAATVGGVLLSFVVAEAVGTGPVALGVGVAIGLALARIPGVRTEGITIATTVLFVLTTGYQHQPVVLLERVLDTAIGVAVGVVVNLLVLPPLNSRSASQQVDRINRELGQLLIDMSDQLGSSWTEEDVQSWIDRSRGLDERLQRAWRVVRIASESKWWNPRFRFRRRVDDDPAGYHEVLKRLEDGIAQARSIARTIHESTVSQQEWDARFRKPWLELLAEVGGRIADPEADVAELHDRADDLSRTLSDSDLPSLLWPVYGALISDLANIIDITDDVATSRPPRP